MLSMATKLIPYNILTFPLTLCAVFIRLVIYEGPESGVESMTQRINLVMQIRNVSHNCPVKHVVHPLTWRLGAVMVVGL